MVVVRIAILSALAALSNAAPSSVKHVVHEARHKPSADWVKGSRIESSAILPVRIGLSQTNLEIGHEFLMDVSDPKSSNYGKYWSADEVHNKFAPPEKHVDAVKEWLIAAGIAGHRVVHSDNKGWLAFDATVEEVEQLLQAEYHEHDHVSSDKIRVGCDKYHVPEHLAPHIDYITPGVKLTQVVKRDISKKKRSTQAQAVKASTFITGNTELPKDWAAPAGLAPDVQTCGFNMTPTCIKALYDIPEAPKQPHKGNALGLYEQGDYFAKSDLDLYWKNIYPAVPQGTYPTPALIDGANYSVPAYSSLNTGESDIDIEMAFSLIYPQSVTLYQVDDQIYEPKEVATTNLFNTFLDALDGSYCTYEAYGEKGDDPSIDPNYPDPAAGGYKGKLQCGVYKPTNVISASYGQAEADLPRKYTERQCNEFLKLGLQGHSILFASGDYGVASFPNDGGADGCLGPDGKIFNPQYPSNCPYVTSVGGTMLYNGQSVQDTESVMHVDLGGTAVNFSTAGGFSNYFVRPWYQEEAVERYFQKADLSYPYYSELSVDVNTTKGLYNRIGRAYPDVSANGAYFPSFLNAKFVHFFGSSLASPLFASVLTLLNEERLSVGKGPIGFINPVLYANPHVLNDITNGTNVGCGTEGFSAIEGWDPATGLGTPNYPKLKELFLALP
ncbi:peptidase S8/S53 domain-containing protein [Talaromyces proteolyticus]|uniref:Peptidase S8/S53 domain-containing protein n=1 Tax=Talaromyces proteolyticus TaxID=1131652 RepID=A0AAD4KHU2_9EURO|nr:peptidase S8/S53 domain-containing protein [Talaromyces proteolyticus]KAH8690679.1 peptidase S8/S53 domain-containing protein [Talaromyces proteolyticus]